MSPSTIAIFLVFLTCLWFLIKSLIISSSSASKLPPGPWSLPIIGHLHMLGNLPHRRLQDLAEKYGPIMSLRLGSIPTIVVSSPKAAELFLKTHDANFASRPRYQASEYMHYGSKGMGLAEYGPYWRHTRKLCTLQLLCPSKVQAFAPLRREEIGLLLQALKKAGEEGQVVDLSEMIYEMNEDITYRMILGCKRDDRFDLKGIIHETVLALAAFNLADVVPSLGALDLQGITRRFKRNSKKIDELLETIIQDHEQARAAKNTRSTTDGQQGHYHEEADFVDVLLSLINKPLNPNDHNEKVPLILDRENVKAILLDMIIAAYETSATAVVWTLAELLRNPRVMKNLQQELESVIGKDRMVDEFTDMRKLAYLNMVVNESLRLHPIAPLLFPHESINDTTVEGYNIPKKSRIIVNVWSIGRDPKVWSENAEEFYPERFMNSNVDLLRHDFQLIPFGSGRRACPGIQLGLITVRLVVAHLVHCFDWEQPTGLQPQDLDMSEKFSISMMKASRLASRPIASVSNPPASLCCGFKKCIQRRSPLEKIIHNACFP